MLRMRKKDFSIEKHADYKEDLKEAIKDSENSYLIIIESADKIWYILYIFFLVFLYFSKNQIQKNIENLLIWEYFNSKDSRIYFILRMKCLIDDSFVSQLFSHPSFQLKLSAFSSKSKQTPSKKILDDLT